MDGNLRTIITECIQDIETGGADVHGCLERHPDRAEELRPHLSLTRFAPRSVAPAMTEAPIATNSYIDQSRTDRRFFDIFRPAYAA
jgi:hypothetical protein